MTGVLTTWSTWVRVINTQGQNVDDMDNMWFHRQAIGESSPEVSEAPQDLGIEWGSWDEGIFVGGKAYEIPASSLQLLIGNDLQDVFELRARGAGAMHTRVRLYRVQLCLTAGSQGALQTISKILRRILVAPSNGQLLAGRLVCL